MFAKRSIQISVVMVALGATLSASGKAAGGGATGTVATNTAGTGTTGTVTLRIPNETVPAGSMVQMKVLTTEVTPISGGRPSMGYDTTFSSVAGFGMFAPIGEIAGAAVISPNHVQIFYSGSSTLTANYPILTVVLPVRPDAPVGTKAVFSLDPTSLWNFGTTGPVTATSKPATVTVGGDTAINDVIPGEGVWPAGTIVTVKGVGFNAKTSLRVNDAGIKLWRVVSPTEIQFVLPQATNMRGLRITASGRNTVTYYAYMRGITAQVSARTLLATTEPIFSVNARSVATFGPLAALPGSQYHALALQNPHFLPAVVTVALHNADGTLNHQATRVLLPRNRLTLEVSELLDGVAPPPGSSVVVTSSLPIDAFRLLVDEGTGSIETFLAQ
jgi:IPT/TIG domain-containing protein